MQSIRKYSVFLCALMVCALGGQSFAAPAYDALAPFTGTRTASNGDLVTTDDDWDDAEIEWNITENEDGSLHYEYTLRNFNMPAVSHVTLDLTDAAILGPDAEDNPGLVFNLAINGVLVGDEFLEFGDIDGITGGVKLDSSDPEDVPNVVAYSFDSFRLPVFGHFFVKAGGGSNQSILTNSGFGNETLEDPLAYVARPDSVVPEPMTVFILGAGGLWVATRRRRRQ